MCAPRKCYSASADDNSVIRWRSRNSRSRYGGNKGFEERIGVMPLCPIGHDQYGTCILFMDDKGRVYGGLDEVVTLVGPTGEKAIDNILSGAEVKILEPKINAIN